MKGTLLGLLVGAILWGGSVWTSALADYKKPEHAEFIYYPNGAFLREAALGYEQAASALAWIRTVQYYGEHVRTDQQFDMLYHMCTVTTDLDPRFEEPYVFGGLVLLTEGKQPTAGMKLLEKGRTENPDNWRIHFETGFCYYIVWEDYQTASQYFTMAAAMPGAPEQARRFAAWVSYRAGDIRTSLYLWADLAERTTNPELREKAIRRVEELTRELESQAEESPSGAKSG
jgi:hypothetical protein